MALSKHAYHSNGAVQTIEAVDEAIWSHVLDAEMSQGSNKVVAVILTGTYAEMPDTHQKFSRAIIIREMAMRPAHFMKNFSRAFKDDQARLQDVLPKILKSLPYPPDFKARNQKAKLRAGVLEVVRREAAAQAEYYAKRM